MNPNNPAAIGALARGDVENFLVAATPGGIERQEAQGQRSFNETDILPKEVRGVTREQLIGLGFVFGEDYDDIFVKAQLPPGWSKRATSHSMHTDLLDEKGRARGGVFYKAAFYDRHADMQLNQRFYVRTEYPQDGTVRVFAHDASINAPAKDFGSVPEIDNAVTREQNLERLRQKDELLEEAELWLKDNYPDYRNPLAYWD
jgi:hypothetical protein